MLLKTALRISNSKSYISHDEFIAVDFLSVLTPQPSSREGNGQAFSVPCQQEMRGLRRADRLFLPPIMSSALTQIPCPNAAGTHRKKGKNSKSSNKRIGVGFKIFGHIPSNS